MGETEKLTVPPTRMYVFAAGCEHINYFEIKMYSVALFGSILAILLVGLECRSVRVFVAVVPANL